MKKILYGTTALVAVALLSGVSAQAAEPIKLAVGGTMQQWFGVVNNKNETTNSNGQTTKPNHTGLNTDTMVTFSGKTTTDSGITVGAVIKMNAISNGGGAGRGAARNGTVDQEYATVGGGFGTIRAGVVQSQNTDMHNSGPDLGIGAGDVAMWLAVPTGMQTFRRTGTGSTNGQENWGGTSFKSLASQTLPQAEYITPQLYGFSAGASFAPSGNAATVGPADTLNAAQTHNAWDTTLAYSGTIGPIKLGADIGMAKGYAPKVAPIAVTALASSGVNTNFSYEAYNGGMKVGFGGFTLAGSYMRMMERKVGSADALAATTAGTVTGGLGPRMTGHSYDAGLSYAATSWGVSAMYYEETHLGDMTNSNTTRNNRTNEKFSTYLLSGKYTLGPGIDLVSTGFYADYKGKDMNPATNSHGYGLVSGVNLVF